MNNEAARQTVISELYNLYTANGFITEDEALACFAVYEILLSEIDSISEHLLGLGVLIRTGDDEDEEEALSDRSKLDYNEIYKEVLEINPGLEMLIDYVRAITPPQNREWQKLIPQIQNGNSYAQNRLVEMYLRTVIKQALYYSKRYNLPLEDTIQDGILGIIIATRKFDPASHDKFSTYAPWWIGQSIVRRMWVPTNPMYFPAHIKEVLFQAQERLKDHACGECCDNTFMICPTLCFELSEIFNITVERAKELVSYLIQCCPVDEFVEKGEALSDYGECHENLLDGVEAMITSNRIFRAIKSLSVKERQVLILRYGLEDNTERTLEEVGQKMAVTRERIRQIEANAFRKLRKKFGVKEPEKKSPNS